jgi:AbrB family looped-hinge helix DNA binding protein
MTLRMDQAGRVTLPKSVRERLSLKAGSELDVQETAEGIVLRSVGRGPSMIEKQGLWVHTGQVPPGYDICKAIDEDREEQIRRAWGVDAD